MKPEAKQLIQKLAFSVTRSGHQRDADDYNTDSAYHHGKARAQENYAERSPLSSLLIDPPGSHLVHRLSARMRDRDARMHEKGENSYLPFGGLLTPSRQEKAENRGNAHEKKAEMREMIRDLIKGAQQNSFGRPVNVQTNTQWTHLDTAKTAGAVHALVAQGYSVKQAAEYLKVPLDKAELAYKQVPAR